MQRCDEEAEQRRIDVGLVALEHVRRRSVHQLPAGVQEDRQVVRRAAVVEGAVHGGHVSVQRPTGRQHTDRCAGDRTSPARETAQRSSPL